MKKEDGWLTAVTVSSNSPHNRPDLIGFQNLSGLIANMKTLRSQFLLDPNVIFLNHGSFGATPRPVFDVYQDWQHRLERQPVQFIANQLPEYLAVSRQALGKYIHAEPDNLVYIPNATYGLNIVARSLDLGKADEVLTTDHEYGACTHVWQFLSQKHGFQIVQQHIPLPIAAPEVVLEQFWQGVTAKTRVIYLSHITSTTAIHFPVEAICKRARKAGILTIIDGAHAPGQIPLDMQQIDADFYFGNAHKWLCSPKGAAFLYANPTKQHLIEPLIVSWGWGENRSHNFGSDFLDFLQILGTDDMSAYLSVPAAIEFQEQNGWMAVTTQCHKLAHQAMQRIAELTGLPSPYPDHSHYVQMAIAPLPPIADLPAFKAHLYDQFRVEIPCTEWNGRQFIRVSVQGYNTQQDIDCLIKALRSMLGEA